MVLGAVYPFFTYPDGVSVWFGLKPHAHERVVWISAIKVTVWFNCVEWGNIKKPLILIYKTLVCVCLYVRLADLSATLSLFGEFHALLHTISCNFHTMSHNFGYIIHFWANFNMLGIKMHVFELRN